MVLCIILFRSVLIPLRRLPTLYWRVFIIGEEIIPFIVRISVVTRESHRFIKTWPLSFKN